MKGKDRTRWDVVVVGGANMDYLVRGATLPKPGETIEGHTFLASPGGKGANQAVAAARLGARVAFVGRVGTDAPGRQLLEQLDAEGVDIRHVVRDKKHPTGVALIMVEENGQKSILTAPGANRHLSVTDLHGARETIRNSRVLLTQFEAPLPVVKAAALLARQAGARVVLDPAPPVSRPDASLMSLVHVVRPNAAEAEALTRIKVHDRATAKRAARRLLQRGVELVAVQGGHAGNLLVWPDGELWLPKLRVKSIDATGAGDAFVAALAVALAEGRSISDAGWFANGAAALATTKLGAQPALPRRQAVAALLSRCGLKMSR
jgi:ribokinase